MKRQDAQIRTKHAPGIQPVRTIQQVAELVGVSRRRVQQIEDRAMAKLREAIQQPEFAELAGYFEPDREPAPTGQRRNRTRFRRLSA